MAFKSLWTTSRKTLTTCILMRYYHKFWNYNIIIIATCHRREIVCFCSEKVGLSYSSLAKGRHAYIILLLFSIYLSLMTRPSLTTTTQDEILDKILSVKTTTEGRLTEILGKIPTAAVVWVLLLLKAILIFFKREKDRQIPVVVTMHCAGPLSRRHTTAMPSKTVRTAWPDSDKY